MILHYMLLLLVIALSIYTVIVDKKEYKKFQQAKTTTQRQAFYKSWWLKSYLMIGLPAVAILLLLQKTQCIFQPVWTNETILVFNKEIAREPVGFAVSLLVGVPISMFVIQGFVTFMRTRWERGLRTATIGDVQALLPRNAAERRWGFRLSIAAGLNEELLLRVVVPVLLIGIVPKPEVAIILSIVWFGLLHIYQGVVGVVGTMMAGAMLMGLYLISGSIFAAMAMHAIIDVNAFVVQPLIAEQTLKFMARRAKN